MNSVFSYNEFPLGISLSTWYFSQCFVPVIAVDGLLLNFRDLSSLLMVNIRQLGMDRKGKVTFDWDHKCTHDVLTAQHWALS